ncbi:MAG: HYR domain-containing protein [Saprospiraceae bacterium]|nr:HYR domain-containing protein [Saprospiraceae bacterium]
MKAEKLIMRILKTNGIHKIIKSGLLLLAILIFNAEASAQTVVSFNYTGSLQTWVVPAGVTLVNVKAYGAQGGHGGGKGAFISGDIAVTPGETINILVGGQGGEASNDDGGGGGGSFVWKAAGNVLVIVSGGGGGRSGNSNGSLGGDGSATTTPTNSINGSGNGAGGGGGNGGSGGNFECGTCGYPGTGGGGAGWFSNGLQGTGGTYRATGGFTPLNGGAGGVGFNPCNGINVAGGFGGGGGAGGCSGASGGGGGYNGGGGGHEWNGSTWGSGGGGGSYNSGSSQVNTAGVRMGNGMVEITINCSEPKITCPFNIVTVTEPNKCSVFLDDLDPEVCSDQTTRIALNFDGSNDVVQGPNDVIPDAGEYTVMIWAKQKVSQTGSFRNIISQGRCFYIGHDANNPPGVRIGDSWSSPGVLWPTDLNWHHYTVVRTATNAYLYIDGILKATKGSPISNPNCGIGWPHNLNIATQWTGANEHFNGDIDELQIWNYPLSADLINCNKDQILLGNEPGLVAYYNFEDGTGSSILSCQVNAAHNGSLINMDPASDWVASPQPFRNYNLKNSFNNTCDAAGNYPTGNTAVYWTVTDYVNNSASCSFSISVNDTQKPTINCPANFTVSTVPGQCDMKVCYPSPTVTDNCPPATPAGYTYKTSYGNSYYYTQNGYSDFATALNNATAAGGHLASITSAAENAVIAASGAGYSWIGGNDVDAEGSWKWNNCEPFSYANWCPGEPNGSTFENYLEYTPSNCFNDLLYYANRSAILEIEGAKLERTSGLVQNAVFPLGMTTLNFKATDKSGNTSTCSFKITVEAGSCGQPIQVYHKDTTTNSAKIKWNPGTPCNTGYQLRIRYEISTGVWSSWSAWANKSGPGNEHAFAGLSSSTYYQYQIRSKCGSTNSIVVNGWFHTLGGGSLRKYDDGLVNVYKKIETPDQNLRSSGELTSVSLKVIPNPAKDFVSIQLRGFDKNAKTISMMDLLGKQVFKALIPASENDPELDLVRLNLANGAFIIHVDDGVNRKTEQLIIQR